MTAKTDDAASESKPLAEKSNAELKREARARIRHLDPMTASELVNEVVAKQAGSFVAFLREHAIVGLAIGFVLGTQVQVVVKQVTDSFINPLFQLLFPANQTELAQRTFNVSYYFRGQYHYARFGWGAILYTLIDFIFIVLTIYIIIKFFKLDKLDKSK
jgi:large-conductance mechanosensitive channel